MAKTITASEFEKEVLQSDVPVILDFFASWCKPCVAMSPVLDELSDEFEGKAKVLKMDTDANKEVAMKYEVRSIPNMVFFKNGEVVERSIGRVEKEELVDKLNALI